MYIDILNGVFLPNSLIEISDTTRLRRVITDLYNYCNNTVQPDSLAQRCSHQITKSVSFDINIILII